MRARGALARATFLLGLFFAAAASATTLSESPATVVRGGSVTATWSEILAPTSTDWIALYAPGAANTSYVGWRYTTGTASGSVPFTIPATVTPGTYELRLFANNGYTLLATSNSFTVTTPALTATPTAVIPGGSETATWSDILSPTSTDWIGLYTPSAADSSYISFRYTTGAASGSVPFSIPAGTALGTYQLRLFSNNGYTRLATSNNFTVGSLTMTGTVTAGGAPLAGVGFTAGAGTACVSSDASGQYSCSVPQGWSGSVTPSLTGYLFTPASRSYTNVTSNQTAQDYAASVSYQLSGTVTSGGSPLAGVVFAATNGVTCTSSNASGQYSCTVPQGWSGTVTPSLSSYAFTPASRSYTNITANQAQDYSAVPYYQVSGTVTAGGSPLSGVALSATNGVSCSTTNASGQYTCTVPGAWSGTVTPSLTGYNFSPVSRNYGSVGGDQTAQDYVANTITASNRIYFIHTDHLNTPRLVANAAGTTVWRWDQQEPFGDSVPDENPSGLGAFDLPLRLPGQRYDRETGLHYNNYRDFDPTLGRYGESDPIGLHGGLNTYTYVDSNPLKRMDRLGLTGEEALGEGGSRGGSGIGGLGDVFIPGTPANQAFVRSINQIGQAIKNACTADKDECYERWDKEDKDCQKWTGFGYRWVRACKDRAAARLRLCYRNGGKPDPDEPPVWRPD